MLTIANGTASAPYVLRADTRRVRRQPCIGRPPETGMTQTLLRPRPAHGPTGVPLDGLQPLARAVSRQVLLQRPASRAEGILDVLRSGRARTTMVLPRARPTWNDESPAMTSARYFTTRSARLRRREFEHVGFWDLRVRDGRRLPERAALRRRRRRAQPPAVWRLRHQHRVSRMRATLAGSSPPRCKVGADPGLSSPTTRSEGRSFSRRHGISSRGQSRPTDSFWIRSVRNATWPPSSTNGELAGQVRRSRSLLSSPTTEVPRSCGETPEAGAVLLAPIASPHGQVTTSHPCGSRRVATSSRS